MAFNIMDLFGPAARNMLLQPAQSAQGVQNMLLTRPSPKDYPVASAPAPMPAVDPQTTAAVQGPAPQPVSGPQVAQAAPAPGGSGSFLTPDRKAVLNDFFLGLAAGQTPQQSLTLGAVQASKGKKERGNLNQTVEWLKSRGMSDEEARMTASSQPALNEYLKNIYETSKPIEVGGRLVDPKTYKVVADFSDPNAKLTTDQREYQAAKDQGFTGSFMDYQIKMKEAGRSQVNVDTGVKLPSGYRWVDPNNQQAGVEPIPGGPATQIPGELAARVGMGENFLTNDLPFLRKKENLEEATGWIDRGRAYMGWGKPAEIQRKFQSGVEVLSRLLSGAGMTQVEIDEKTARYMPTMSDTPESLTTKLDQLEAEIKAAGDAAMRGRGGSISSAPSPAAAPSGGGNVTANGVQWTVE